MSTTPPWAAARRRVPGALIAALVVLGVALTPAVAAIVVSLQNDAAAGTVRDQLVSLPLPRSSELVDSHSQAGKLVGNGNGMQYLGAILLHSDLTAAELETHYAEQADVIDESRESELAVEIIVEESSSTQLHDITGMSSFLSRAGQPELFVVYMWGDAPSWFHRDLDLRGH